MQKSNERARSIRGRPSCTFASLSLAAGRRDEAVAAAKHALAIDPGFFPVNSLLGHLHDLGGEAEAALDEYRAAFRLSGG